MQNISALPTSNLKGWQTATTLRLAASSFLSTELNWARVPYCPTQCSALVHKRHAQAEWQPQLLKQHKQAGVRAVHTMCNILSCRVFPLIEIQFFLMFEIMKFVFRQLEMCCMRPKWNKTKMEYDDNYSMETTIQGRKLLISWFLFVCFLRFQSYIFM